MHRLVAAAQMDGCAFRRSQQLFLKDEAGYVFRLICPVQRHDLLIDVIKQFASRVMDY